MKILLIQSPRKYWPYLSHGDNYILPQWMPCLASVLRESGHSVVCVDCMASKIGWSSLESLIREEAPEMVCISEAHAMYIYETLKLASLIKKIDEKTFVVAGGGHFSNTAEASILEPSIDIIVRGEGEATLRELADFIENRKDISEVEGITYKKGSSVISNKARPLIEDLDELPLPAYDLMPMDQYGKSRYLFSPGGITIHHSRGCPNNCRFCVWWTQMAERSEEEGREILKPRWRTKSVLKTVDEIELLLAEYNRKCFIFVDGTWNADPAWSNDFAEEILKRELDIKWFAFMRMDYILRDIGSGLMKKLVNSGLSHICIGIEHCSPEIMDDFKKKGQDTESSRQCLDLMREKFPNVFIQATFIIGTKSESKKTLKELAGYVKSLKLDYPAFHIFTPVPGTRMHDEAKEAGLIEIDDYSKYDWNTALMSTDHLKREEIEEELYYLYKNVITLKWLFKGLLSLNKYKRDMYVWWLIVSIRVALSSLKDLLHIPSNAKRLVTPSWYEK